MSTADELALADPSALDEELRSLRGEFVRIGITGDGRPAVLELGNSGEPLQYLARTSAPKKLLEQWDDVFRGARLRVGRGW